MMEDQPELIVSLDKYPKDINEVFDEFVRNITANIYGTKRFRYNIKEYGPREHLSTTFKLITKNFLFKIIFKVEYNILNIFYKEIEEQNYAVPKKSFKKKIIPAVLKCINMIIARTKIFEYLESDEKILWRLYSLNRKATETRDDTILTNKRWIQTYSKYKLKNYLELNSKHLRETFEIIDKYVFVSIFQIKTITVDHSSKNYYNIGFYLDYFNNLDEGDFQKYSFGLELFDSEIYNDLFGELLKLIPFKKFEGEFIDYYH
ncbi:MAG: hypothetical protein ACFFHV_23335 [Promethearchaeota archaeon]